MFGIVYQINRLGAFGDKVLSIRIYQTIGISILAFLRPVQCIPYHCSFCTDSVADQLTESRQGGVWRGYLRGGSIRSDGDIVGWLHIFCRWRRCRATWEASICIYGSTRLVVPAGRCSVSKRPILVSFSFANLPQSTYLYNSLSRALSETPSTWESAIVASTGAICASTLPSGYRFVAIAREVLCDKGQSCQKRCKQGLSGVGPISPAQP